MSEQALEIVLKALDNKLLAYNDYFKFYNLLLAGEISDIVLTAKIAASKINGLTKDELAAAAKSLLEKATSIDIDGNVAIDCVGSGGDGSNSLNISSLTSIIAAKSGLKIAKHGNRSFSSKCGSADMLEKLGLNISMSPKTAARLFNNYGFTFLFAPTYHSGVKNAANVRKNLKTKTIFNILGPLINPARVKHLLLGVYDKSIIDLVADSLIEIGVYNAWVVNGTNVDEISANATSYICQVNNGKKSYFNLDPQDFGIKPSQVFTGGDIEKNAAISRDILNGKGRADDNNAIAINVAAMFKIMGYGESLSDLTSKALKEIATGDAMNFFNKLAKDSHAN